MKRLVVVGLVALCAVGLWARQTVNTFDTQQAVNQVLPINYTVRLDFTPTMNSRVMPPAATGMSEIFSNKIAIDGMNQIRIDDWSVPLNTSFNVTARFYAPVTSIQSIRSGGLTMNRYVTDLTLMTTANIPLNYIYYVTGNRYSVVDFLVQPKITSTVSGTFNLTIRNSDKTLGETITHDMVVLTGGTAVKLDYANYRVVKLSNFGSPSIYLGGEGITSTNFGEQLNSTYGRSVSFGDSGYTGYAVSNGTVTLNVLLLK